MQVFSEITPLKTFLAQKKCQKIKIGLVPTMGALHDGHLELVKESRIKCDLTVVSIFVNRTQFNDQDDFDNYPNLISQDLKILEQNGVDIVFNPYESEMYPTKPVFSVNFGEMESVMEGKYRPNHFSGVGLVVSKLFNIVNPDLAFFGQKDFQQLSLIKRLTTEFNFGVEIVSVPTVREESGLAMSSRNLRLSKEQLEIASEIFRTINIVKKELLSGKTVDEAKDTAVNYINNFNQLRLEYLEVVDSADLKVVNSVDQHDEISICVAAYLGDVRLIDNLYLFSR